jgi:AcrR family transcriptional regulator
VFGFLRHESSAPQSSHHPQSTEPVRRPTPQASAIAARATADAIRDAFFQLLAEKPYDRISIRQVIGLAGVGIGSFYEYFSCKDALAAVCIHLRVKAIAATMRASIDAHRTEPLPARVDALIDAQSARRWPNPNTGRRCSWSSARCPASRRSGTCTRSSCSSGWKRCPTDRIGPPTRR